jgi:hypothetical protein
MQYDADSSMSAACACVVRVCFHSEFKYSNLKINASTIGHCESVSVSVDVTNFVDGVDGEEVVQL